MFGLFLSPEIWVSLLTLTVLEIVLGVDNLVFVSLLSAELPYAQQRPARLLGLGLACLTRLMLLFAVVWILHFTQPLFAFAGRYYSGRDLLLILGGVFLLAKGTSELHHGTGQRDQGAVQQGRFPKFSRIVIQIMLLDIVFSFDSVMTAVGIAQSFGIMALAIVIAIIVMIVASEPLSRLITSHPSLRILALSFLLLIGFTLIADGFDIHVPRAYLYFAITFSGFVEWLNILSSRWHKGGGRNARANTNGP